MGLKERIEKLEAINKSMKPQYYGGYDEAKHEAAQLAAEADDLMDYMREALEIMLIDDTCFTAEDALERYKQYTETQND